MSFKTTIKTSLNEKDVENIYRSEFLKIKGTSITSPHNVDGLLQLGDMTALLEFKYNVLLKEKTAQAIILIQCLYYLKKFELNGEKQPQLIVIGDINECFVIHSNDILKYLSSDVDWSIAPSQAHTKNITLLQELIADENIKPFVFDIDDNFEIRLLLEKANEFVNKIIRKIRVTPHNVVSVFDYFDKHVLGKKCTLSSNEKANLFIQIIVNPNNNFLHPKKKNVLQSQGFGEISVVGSTFQSFFAHFEGDLYSPKEKESLTSLVDRLVDDTTRRRKGEFFTPTPFVDLAHKYVANTFGEDWKERFVVADVAMGTGNLTRDYKFKELYLSTLESSDIETANQMGYNMEATKFQFDFLNDDDSKMPQGLQDAINSGREILFLINPPYATSANMGTIEGDHKGGLSNTRIGNEMKAENWGASSQNLYAQFLYRIAKYQEINKNVTIGVFCPPLFLSGGSYKAFRAKFLELFGYECGFLFQASHFADTSAAWGISFTIFSGINK